ncbi:hypothetical protein RCF19_31710, partial [Rhodococcus qingshengii]
YAGRNHGHKMRHKWPPVGSLRWPSTGDAALTDITSGAIGGGIGSVKDGLVARNEDLNAAGLSPTALNWDF